MRKHFLGLAVLALLLAASGCAKETRESATDNDGRISFRTVLGKQVASRATEFKNNSWTNADKITVEAFLGGSTTVEKTFTLETTDNGATWGYGTPYNQPGYELRYYAVFPAVTGGASTADGKNYEFDYAVAATHDVQKDLIAAGTTTAEEVVNLEFKHLLSQVNFAVQGIKNVEIEVGQLAVKSVNSEGTYTFGTGWADQKTAANYDYYPTGVTTHASDYFTLDGTSSAVAYMGNGGGTYTSTNALMLMPQAFAAEGDGTFSFNFSLTTKDKDGNDVVNADNLPVTVNLCDFDTQAWDAGKRYVYVIDFTSYIVGGPITFKVNVSTWEDAGTSEIAQTIHVADAKVKSVESAIALHSSANTAALKTFPISISNAINDDITITRIYGFDAGDEIRIECLNATDAAKVKLSMNGWVRTESGRVVTLKCTTPSAAGASVVAASGADDTEIEAAIKAAITALAANNTGTEFVDYTITVSNDITTGVTLDAITGTYIVGDRIRISCTSAANAGKITVSDADWDAVVVGNDVLISRK